MQKKSTWVDPLGCRTTGRRPTPPPGATGAGVDCLVNGRSPRPLPFFGQARMPAPFSRSRPGGRTGHRADPFPPIAEALGEAGRAAGLPDLAGRPRAAPGLLSRQAAAAFRAAGGGRWPERPILGRWRARWLALAGREGIGQAGRKKAPGRPGLERIAIGGERPRG